MSMVMERATTGGQDLIQHSSWLQIKEACVTLQGFQASDGRIAGAKNHSRARNALNRLTEELQISFLTSPTMRTTSRQ